MVGRNHYVRLYFWNTILNFIMNMTHMHKKIQIASRTSQLAKIMTNHVIQALKTNEPDIKFEILDVKTSNQNIKEEPLGIKGVFTNALDAAVRDGLASFAVHSTKDLPSKLSDDMVVAAFLKRANPKDALISKHGLPLNQLPQNGSVGTASMRRAMLIKHLRSDLSTEILRGNIDTRLSKKDQFDAIILAASGLERFGGMDHITEQLDPTQFVPAAGQGVIAITCLKDDIKMASMLTKLDDIDTRLCVEIERTICERLNLSCHAPIGVYAYLDNENILLKTHLIRNKKTFIGSFKAKRHENLQLIEDALSAIKQKTDL